MQTNLPLLPVLRVRPVLSPFGMPLPPVHPCPGHRPQDTGQGAEQGPEGEGRLRGEGVGIDLMLKENIAYLILNIE